VTRSRPCLLPHALVAVALALGGGPARPDDLPSPDAVALGQRAVPRSIVDGFREGVAGEVLDRATGARAGAADAAPLRARARAALEPLLDEAFPPDLLAGLAAQFLARSYTAGELRALRDREEAPLGRKLRDLDARAAQLPAADPAARDREREALARKAFTRQERAELEAFAASPLGRKVEKVGPELARHFLDQLDRRWAEVRAQLEPRLRRAAAEALDGAAAGR
jgi:hypothetical protein